MHVGGKYELIWKKLRQKYIPPFWNNVEYWKLNRTLGAFLAV